MADAWEKLKPTPPSFNAQPYQPQTPEPANPMDVWKRLAPTDLRTMISSPQVDPWWGEYRASRYAAAYASMLDMAELQYKDRPEKKEEEVQKIQLAFYVGDRLGVEADEVYGAFDSQGRNPYMERYFQATEMPATYARFMKQEAIRAFTLYRAMNQASEMMFGGFNREKVLAMQETLDNNPPELPTRDRGPLWNFFKRVPARALAQLPYIMDMGLGQLVGGTIGAGVGYLAGGPGGAKVGFDWGRRIGGFTEAIRLDSAQIFMDSITYPDPNTKKPLYQVVRDPEELWAYAQKTALAGGVLTGAASGIAFESMVGRLPQLMKDMGLEAIHKAGESGVFRDFAGQMLRKYGKNLGTQMTAMDLEILVQQVAANAVAATAEIQPPPGAPGELAGQPQQVQQFTPKDYARLALQGLPGAFETSLLIALPGSIGEARRAQVLDAQRALRKSWSERADRLEQMSDTSRPLPVRAAEIDTRLEQLRQEQEKLGTDLEGLETAVDINRDMQRKIESHRNNQIEIEYLQSLKRDAEAKAPDQSWQRSRDEQEAVEASRRQAAEQGAAERRAPAPPELEAERASFRVEDRSQVTPELETRLIDYHFKTRSGQPIPTAAELHSRQNVLLTGGIAGGGKTDVLGITGAPLEQYVTVDPDSFKNLTGLTTPKDHPWTSQLADRLIDKAMQEGYKVKLDTQLSDFSRADDVIQQTLKNKGIAYVAFTYVRPETARARSILRERIAQRHGKPPRPIPLSITAKGFNRSLPTFLQLRKKYASNPDVRFYLSDNDTDLATPKTIIRNNEVLDPAALDAIAAIDYAEIKEDGKTRYERTDRITEADLAAGEGEARARADRLDTHIREQGALAAGDRGGAGLPPLEGRYQLTNDIAPDSPVVGIIREGLPNLPLEQAQGAAILAKLYAAHAGMQLEPWIKQEFIRGIFSAEKSAELEAAGHRGGIYWTSAGKAVFLTTTKSDFVTWVHELTHHFERSLNSRERAAVEGWLGISGAWTEANKESFANSAIAYMAKGNAPNQDLAPIFARFTRWVNQVYEAASVEWDISPDIVKMYNEALSGTMHGPKEAVPGDANILFETRPPGETPDAQRIEPAQIEDPADLTPQTALRMSDFMAAWKKFYYDNQGNVASSSRLTPAEITSIALRPGIWMVDDGFKGIHGHEIAQLRWLDPYNIELSEADYTRDPNWEGRGDDAIRYAQWLEEGKTPPPVNVVETDAGTLRLTDGHRRVAAAKMAKVRVMAWVYPSAEHPAGLMDAGLGRVQKVGLTYEMATGRSWESDQPIKGFENFGILYETRPGDQDPWILKSRQLILEKMRGPMPAADLRAMLEKGGVKPEEMEWLGLTDFLKENRKIRPEEVLQHIKDNDLQIKEIIAGELDQAVVEEKAREMRDDWIQERATELFEQADPDMPSYDVVAVEEDGETHYYLEINGERTEEWYSDEQTAEAAGARTMESEADEIRERYFNRAQREARRYRRNFMAEAREKLRKQTPTLQHARWQLEGKKEDQHELLITMAGRKPKELTAEEYRRQYIQQAGPGWEATPADEGNIAYAYDRYREEFQAGRVKRDYTGGHYGQDYPNVLLHIRFNTRTTPEGKRVLFIEEIQSDWHQAARKLRKAEIRRLAKEKGISRQEAAKLVPFDWAYKDQPRPASLPESYTARRITQDDVELAQQAEDYEVGDWGLFDETGEYITGMPASAAADEAAARIVFAQDAADAGVELEYLGAEPSELPDAPFKKTWHELGFRRMLRWAAENGYDEVAWTTGEQQSIRYSLEKHVDKLVVRRGGKKKADPGPLIEELQAFSIRPTGARTGRAAREFRAMKSMAAAIAQDMQAGTPFQESWDAQAAIIRRDQNMSNVPELLRHAERVREAITAYEEDVIPTSGIVYALRRLAAWPAPATGNWNAEVLPKMNAMATKLADRMRAGETPPEAIANELAAAPASSRAETADLIETIWGIREVREAHEKYEQNRKNAEGRWEIKGTKKGQSVLERIVAEDEIGEIVGEAIEERALDLQPGESFELTGEDLRIGGEGMRGYYDKMLVDYANRLGKKYQAQVRDINIGETMNHGEFISSMRDAMTEIIELHDDPSSVVPMGVARVQGALEEGATWEEAIQRERDYGNPKVADLIEGYDQVKELLQKRAEKATVVHGLPIPKAMADSVMSGQMLFAASPHEESVRQAVERQMPVPYRVLKEYGDREWARAELDARDYLTRAARQVESFEEFFDWQAKSHQGTIPVESYYRLIWDTSRETAPEATAAEQHFKDTMDGDQIHHAIGSIFLAKGDIDKQKLDALSQEMFTYGTKILDGVRDTELEAKIKEQIDAEPARWRRILGDALPEEGRQELQRAMDATDLAEFVPVIPKVANERFTDRLQQPKEMVHFLLTVGSDELYRANKTLGRLASRLEEDLDYDITRFQHHAQALREVRKSITTYRELYAVATQDEAMLRQLQTEMEKAPETEEARLLQENTRLRKEIAQQLEQMKTASRSSQITIADLNRHIQNLAQRQAQQEAEILEGRQRLKERLAAAKEEGRKKRLVEDIIRGQLHKRRVEELQERAREERAALKAKIRQARETGKQKLIALKTRIQVEKWAEGINRPVNAGIADYQARQIEDIQARIEYDPADVNESLKGRLREWRRQNPTAPLPPPLVQMIEARSPKLITAGEMRQLYEKVKELRTAGRKARSAELLAEKQYMEQQIGEVTKSIRGGKAPADIAGLGTRGALRQVKTPALKKAMWATWRMNRIAEMIDHRAGGPASRWLWDIINDNTDTTIRAVDEYAKLNEAKLLELGLGARNFGRQENIDGLQLTRGQMIGVYIYSQFEDTLMALQQDNRIGESTIAEIIKGLSPEEKQYGDWMIETLSTDADFDRLQQVQLSVSNQRMDRLPRYFPIQRQGMAGNPLLSELARELLDMAGKTSKPRPRQGFLRSRMARTEGVAFPPMRLDAPAIFMDHIAKREFYIANALTIKRMTRIFDSREVKAALQDRFGDAMQPLVQGYIAQYTNPNIYRAFEDYGEFARILRSNVGLSLLGSNVLTMLRQLPDIPQIMMMAGPVDGVRAAAQFLANPRKTIQEVWEKAPQLKRRSYDRFIEEMKMLDRNAYERVVRSAGEAGFAVLKAMDTATNVIGWTAVYNKTLRRTGNETVARNTARDFILRKRPAARAKDLAAIYRSPSLSWFLMFSNQINQQWNILTFDIPQQIARAFRGESGALVDATLNVTGLLIGSIGMGLIARKGAMTKEGLLQDFFNLLFGYTPFIGDAFESAIRGQPSRDALNPFGGAYQVGKLMYDIANQAETEKVMRDLRNALFTLGGTAGLPVVQARRIYKTIDTGDPWELIGGPPKRKEE